MEVSYIVIGTSAGGISAIQKLLGSLSPDFDLPIIVVQHRDRITDYNFEMLYGSYFKGRIVEVIDKTKIDKNTLYFAPANYHLLIEDENTLNLSVENEVNFSRPSIDILFESAARALTNRVCGILLTGANDDGADGLAFLQENGGMVVVQDPVDAEHGRMPTAALEKITPDYVGSLEQIAAYLNRMLNGEK